MKSCARSRKKGLTPRYKSWSRFWEESQLSETDILGEQACLPLQTKWKQSLNDLTHFMSTRSVPYCLMIKFDLNV